MEVEQKRRKMKEGKMKEGEKMRKCGGGEKQVWGEERNGGDCNRTLEIHG